MSPTKCHKFVARQAQAGVKLRLLTLALLLSRSPSPFIPRVPLNKFAWPLMSNVCLRTGEKILGT